MFSYNTFADVMFDSTFLWQGTPVFEKGRLVLQGTYVICSDLNIQRSIASNNLKFQYDSQFTAKIARI